MKRLSKAFVLLLILIMLVCSVSYGASASIINYGDVNLNGRVDISDASELQTYLVGSTKIEAPRAIISADSTGDGFLSILDVSAIQLYCANLVEYMPADKEHNLSKDLDDSGYYNQLFAL